MQPALCYKACRSQLVEDNKRSLGNFALCDIFILQATWFLGQWQMKLYILYLATAVLIVLSLGWPKGLDPKFSLMKKNIQLTSHHISLKNFFKAWNNLFSILI